MRWWHERTLQKLLERRWFDLNELLRRALKCLNIDSNKIRETKKKKLWSRYTPCDDSMYRLTTSTDYALFVPVNKLSLVDKQSKLGRVIGIANWCVLWISDKWLSVTFCFFVLLLDFLISHHRLKSFSAYLLFFFCASTFKLTWKQQTNRKKNKWSFGEVMYTHHELTHRNGWQRMNRQWNLKIE